DEPDAMSMDRVVVVAQQLRAAGAEGRHLLGCVAKAGVARVRRLVELGMPAFLDPYLRPAGEIGDVVVLHAAGVPRQPGDGVRLVAGPEGQLLRREPLQAAVQPIGNAAVALQQQLFPIHGLQHMLEAMAAPLKRLFQIYPDAPHAIQPLGIRLNDTIYAGGISGRDAATGELAPDLESQTALVLHHLKALLERGDAGLDNLARCVAYVTTPEHREPVDAAWLRLWPDERDKPAFKILTGAALPPGELIRLDALALAGGRRTRIDLPNVPAHDPTVRIGNWVFT